MTISLTDYTPITINADTYYLITNLDDQLALAVKLIDISTEDGPAGDFAPVYVVRAQTGNEGFNNSNINGN